MADKLLKVKNVWVYCRRFSDRILHHNNYLAIHTTTLFCKAKIQYLLTCKVSRYCLLTLHGSTAKNTPRILDHGFMDLVFGSPYPCISLRWTNVGLRLGQSCRRWPANKPTINLISWFSVHFISVSAFTSSKYDIEPMLADGVDGCPALNQHWGECTLFSSTGCYQYPQ